MTKQYTTSLPTPIIVLLRAHSKESGIPASEIIVEALANYFGITANGSAIKAVSKLSEVLGPDDDIGELLAALQSTREGS